MAEGTCDRVFDEKRIGAIAGPLLEWYGANARRLPWREDPDAYHVWVSEIMLQQTRVEAVIPYYRRFLEALPAVADLAACPEVRLMKLWEGLGYYSRVRNMQRCAQVLMQEHGGRLPGKAAQLGRLPGIGPYTAGAIASIAYGEDVPAVDGNVLRVISRIVASEEDILLPATRNRVEEALKKALPKGKAGIFNQALMDLGACICLPARNRRIGGDGATVDGPGAPVNGEGGTAANGEAGAPVNGVSTKLADQVPSGVRCGDCPLRSLCLSRERGLTDRIPVRVVKTKRRQEHKTVLVILDGKKAVLRRRPERGLLAGLYELPNLPGRCSESEALAFAREIGTVPLRITPLPGAKHVFTHIDWLMSGYRIFAEEMEELPAESDGDDVVKNGGANMCFAVDVEQVGKNYAVPSAFRSYMQYLGTDII